MKGAILWKRILNQGLFFPNPIDSEEGEQSRELIKSRIITSPLIVDVSPRITNVLAGPEDLQRYRGMAMPFPVFWVEGAIDVGADHGMAGWQIGSLVSSELKPDDSRELFLINFFCSSEWRPSYFGSARVRLTAIGDLDFWSHAPNAERFSIDIPNMGEPFGISSQMRPLREATADNKYFLGWNAAAIIYALDVLLVLGCKNVSLQPHDNDPAAVKRAIKRHGPNSKAYRYHILVVRAPGARSDSPGIDIGIMPRHVCRGHYQHYGPASIHGHVDGLDRGLLFGKHAGRFYVAPFHKGNEKNGTVEKDYEIRQPKEPPADPQPPEVTP